MPTFPFAADAVVNFQTCSFPARSTRTAANLYMRITGIADFNVDPDWEDDALAWHRGTMTFETPQPVLQPGDALLEFALSAGFRQITSDTRSFGIALDATEPGQVVAFGPTKQSGTLTFVVDAAYKGDAWIPDISFAADLLIYRPTLDNPPPMRAHPLKVLISEISRLLG